MRAWSTNTAMMQNIMSVSHCPATRYFIESASSISLLKVRNITRPLTPTHAAKMEVQMEVSP